MRRRDRWFKGRLWGLAIGVTVTLATAVAHVLGVFASLDLGCLDWKFRHVNRIEAHDSIVMIDINDYALERVHKWPWPRRYHADLINTLHELGARSILVDLVWSEPEDGRIDHPALDADRDVDDAGRLLGDMSMADALDGAIWDDQELADALRSSAPVYIAMFGRLSDPHRPPDETREAVYAIFERDLHIGFDSFRSEMGGRLGDETRRTYDALRIAYLLERESFGLTKEQIASRLGVATVEVEKYLAQAKRRVARRLVRAFLSEQPDASFADAHGHFFPDRAADYFTADREDLLRAYRAVTSEQATIDVAAEVPESLRSRLVHMTDSTLPIDKLTGFASVGLVTFETVDARGVMRRVPLLADVRGRMVKQLGFALACDVLDIDERTIRLEEGGLLTMANASGDTTWGIELDPNGQTLINWHVDRARPAWQNSFSHIPVARVIEIPFLRRVIEEQQKRLALLRAECVNIRFADVPAEYNRYVELVQKRDLLLRSEAASPGAAQSLDELGAQIAAIEKEGIDWVIYLGGTLGEDREAGGDAWREQPRAEWIMKLASDFADGRVEKEVATAQANLAARIDEQIEVLIPLISDKLCLVGYTASAVADTVSTPVFKEAPGVMAHANVLNSMLQNRFPRTTPQWIDMFILVAAGLLTTLVTGSRGPWVSLTTVIIVVAALMSVSLALFYVAAMHIVVVAAPLGVLTSWALVTLYRQLTEERQRRAFSKALAQYTSPAIASRITGRSRDLDLSPQPRRVTCFFSDLADFTKISERLGAQRTRALLNPYLEGMSRVLIEQHALINKFIGDGVFAFFNPPIHAVTDHARAGCEAAIQSFHMLESLKRHLAEGPLGENAWSLKMRIGLSTGEVFVGDYGSDSKLDYTCIGDTVNLASRLESANKVFDSRILITETTRQEAGDGYVVRPLGRLQVVGKEQAVEVHELIGRRGEVSDERIAHAKLFSEAVKQFQRRDWSGALATLESCGEINSDDPAAVVLARNVERCRKAHLPAEWNQAIELEVK